MLTTTAVSQRYSSVVGESYSLYSSPLIVVSRASLLVEGVPIGGSLPVQTVGQVNGVQGVAEVTPMLLVVDVQHLVPDNVTIGVPIDNFSMFAKTNTVSLAGAYPTSSDQIVVGGNVAASRNLTAGSAIDEEGRTLTVTGVITTPNLILANAVIMPLETAQAGQGYVGLVSVILVTPSPGQGPGLADRIDASVPGVSAVDPSESERLTSPLVTAIATINGASNAFALGLAALFVSIISSVSIMERREEFATMWAMGGSTASVLKVALAETGLVSAGGLALGFALSAAATAAFFQVYASVPVGTTLSQLLALMPPEVILLAVSAVVGLGLLVGAAATYALPKGVE